MKSPSDTKKEVVRYYSNLSTEYDRLRYGNFKKRIMSNLQIEWFCSKLRENQRFLLEIGSGTGRLTIYLVRLSDYLVATDASYSMLRILKSRIDLQVTENKIEFILCDAMNLPFKKNSFTGIVASRVLWHLTDMKKSVKDSIRILQKKGVLLFDFPNRTGLFRAPARKQRETNVLMLFITFNQIKYLGQYLNVKSEIVGNNSFLFNFLPNKLFSPNKFTNIIMPLFLIIARARAIWPFNLFTNSWLIKYEKVMP